jgi:hypothetical protein
VLPGGHFLVHHVDVTVGSQPVRAIEIIGETDPSNPEVYLARSFDSDGNVEVMHLTVDDDGVFHFSGGSEVASAAQPDDVPTALVRSTLTASEDGSSMQALWERSENRTTWQPWMNMHFAREVATDAHPQLGAANRPLPDLPPAKQVRLKPMASKRSRVPFPTMNRTHVGPSIGTAVCRWNRSSASAEPVVFHHGGG